MATPKTIQNLVSFFQKFNQNFDKISSVVWTLKDIDRWDEHNRTKRDSNHEFLQQLYRHRAFFSQTDIDPQNAKITESLEIIHPESIFQIPKLISWPCIHRTKLTQYATLTKNPHCYHLPTTNCFGLAEWMHNKIRAQLSLPFHHRMEQNLYIIESGGSFILNENDLSQYGCVIMALPTEYEGGNFTITFEKKKYEIKNHPNKLNWTCILSETCGFEASPVISGTQIILVLTLCNQNLDIDLPIPAADPNIILGPVDLAKQEFFIDGLCAQQDGNSMGIILSDAYSDREDYSMDMLTGTDKFLVDKLTRDAGCDVKMYPALYCQMISTTLRAPLPWSSVHLFTKDHLKHAYGLAPKPQCLSLPNVPFFDLGFLAAPVYTEKVLGDSTRRFRFHEQGEKNLYLVPVLVVHFPGWWTRCRLLWIAKFKNEVSECPLAMLPNEILQNITQLVKGEQPQQITYAEPASVHKRRKRDEYDDDDYGFVCRSEEHCWPAVA